MLLLVDNYDSFTYNLAQAFQGLGQDPVVIRNDVPGLLDLAENGDLDKVCLSPGPGHPRAAGLCLEFLARLVKRPKPVPVLGVCLGHQILGEFAGASVYVADRIMHGKTSSITHNDEGLFAGLPQNMVVGRYHSLLVSEPTENMKYSFKVTARALKDEIMGLAYDNLPWAGVQFHPESVLTPQGLNLLGNFIGAPFKADAKQVGGAPKPLSEIFEALGQGRDLTEEAAEQVFERLMDGEMSMAQSGALLLALRVKGETALEVAAAAESVLRRAQSTPPVPGPTLDVVGTGGDNRFSFNCSTATALTCAGLGYQVLKHGNRSVSSRSGSADVLERLGFNIGAPAAEIPQIIAKDKFVFLFAPNYHPAFKHIMPVRQQLGVRTLFNILGPLVNPARPTHRLIGVYQPALLDLIAGALVKMGPVTAAVVHGAGGYDELTTIGPAQVRLIRAGVIESITLDPRAYDLVEGRPEDLIIRDPTDGARVLRLLLAGQGSLPMRDMLIFNVGLAIFLLDGGSMEAAMSKAKEAVLAGVGRALLP
ncbi:MAG: anthranilate phosphoribosyltransferase [Deltaproteobacteria bacterium]|jgi:anthranilate synthase/phosphoribosyltransferase|nr:anthranilate phosphoribosyltransferase [Deltaproteobacteria bacterium]